MKNNLINLLFDRIKSRLPHRATADDVTTGGDEPIILNFVKLVDRWYADVPRWTGSIPQLEMITKPIYTSIYGLSPHLFRAILQDGHSEVLIDEHGRVLSKVK